MTTVPLNSLESFAVLAAISISNTGSTVITGDIGIFDNALTSITGFPPGVVSGTIYATDSGGMIVAQAETDLITAYNDAAGQTVTQIIGTELGGQNLTGGVYTSAAGTFGITGTLTLSGGPDAVYIFQTETTLTTASDSVVLLTNGTLCSNVFWQVGSSATLGTNSIFVGNILAQTSITATTGAIIEGRLLARDGSVTLDTNTVDANACVICLHEDTLIHTDKGLKPIKDVYMNDKVIDNSGRRIPIIKNIHGGYSRNFVKISKNAFATNIPLQDTLISGAHPISLNGKEILPETLINGTTITKVTTDRLIKIYSLVISERIPLKMNNMLIYSWENNEFEQFCKSNKNKQYKFQ